MTKIICSTSQYSIGCTFLDWSINYLSGRKQFFHRHRGWLDIVENPVSKINAHGHQKNHPAGLKHVQDYVNYIKRQTDFVTIYPIVEHLDTLAKQHGIAMEQISEVHFKFLQQQQIKNYNEILHWLASVDAKIIFVFLDKSLSLYQLQYRHTSRNLLTGTYQSADKVKASFDKMFFSNNTDKWHDANLSLHTWDVRERLALDLRPFDYEPWPVDLSIPHLWIDSRELWYNGKSKIQEIMQWLNLDVDQQRLLQWHKVFDQWQQIQFDTIKFQYIYKHILEAILHGWSYPMSLTFDQEVVIQHCLIYQHNLNLKTWQLEKFPSDAKDLHHLLEPNIHPVPKLY